jgi:hypothetical protein
LQGFLRGDAGEQRVGVRLEGGEIDLVALLDRVGEVFEAEVELGGGDFLAAFLFGDFRVVAADGGELGLGGFDGFHQLGAAGGAGFDFHWRSSTSARWVSHSSARRAFSAMAASMRWLNDSISVSRRMETSRSSERRASIGFCCSSAACLARRSTASSVRSSLRPGVEFLLAVGGGVGLRLQAAAFGFERFEALAGGRRVRLPFVRGLRRRRARGFRVRRVPSGRFRFGFEVFDLAGGEAELALQGGEFDFLALQAFAGNFDFLAQAFEVGFEFGDAVAGGLVGGGERRLRLRASGVRCAVRAPRWCLPWRHRRAACLRRRASRRRG